MEGRVKHYTTFYKQKKEVFKIMKRIVTLLLAVLSLSSIVYAEEIKVIFAEDIGISSPNKPNEDNESIDVMVNQFNESVIKINARDEMEWFIEYKKLLNQYSEYLGNPVTLYKNFTADEIQLMLRCIETETYDQDFKSKCNIASVILNRLKSYKFSDDVSTIITAPNQFAYHRTKISESTRLALEYVATFGDTTRGATFFHSNTKTDSWFGYSYIFTDKAGHNFYGGK